MRLIEEWKNGSIHELDEQETVVELLVSLRDGLKNCGICDRRVAHDDEAYWEFWRQQYIDALTAAVLELKKQISEDTWTFLLSERQFKDFR